jgi:hypothetical protein
MENKDFFGRVVSDGTIGYMWLEVEWQASRIMT